MVAKILHLIMTVTVKTLAIIDGYRIPDTGCWIFSQAPRVESKNIRNPVSGIWLENSIASGIHEIPVEKILRC